MKLGVREAPRFTAASSRASGIEPAWRHTLEQGGLCASPLLKDRCQGATGEIKRDILEGLGLSVPPPDILNTNLNHRLL